jgi:hypothetical protein
MRITLALVRICVLLQAQWGMATLKVGKTVESLGDYLREQRSTARLTLRQLADQTGISNVARGRIPSSTSARASSVIGRNDAVT